MKDVSSMSVSCSDGVVSVLDQQLLPQKEVWVECRTLHEIVGAIRALKVRGAPAIGVAAALFVGSEALRGKEREELLVVTQALRGSRPTAVNLMNYMAQIDRVLQEHASNWREQVVHEAEAIFQEDIELCDAIGKHGQGILPDGAQVLTHCNTGGLATVGRGTALGIVTTGHEMGKTLHVWVDETRPLLQGGRLTTWELQRAGVPYTLICDNMAAMLMASGKVDCILVGADRIAMNGDFANKIGTYALSVLAKHHKVPFYVVAPETTIDRDCPDGNRIPIEERRPEEVRGVSGAFGELCWSPDTAKTFNPAFDVTPAELVTGWVFDTGIRTIHDWQ